MLFFSGQFSKNFNIFKGAWRWYPLKKFQFFWFLNQVNVYLGKVTNFWGIRSNKMWRNSRIPLGGVESTPPPVGIRVKENYSKSADQAKRSKSRGFSFISQSGYNFWHYLTEKNPIYQSFGLKYSVSIWTCQPCISTYLQHLALYLDTFFRIMYIPRLVLFWGHKTIWSFSHMAKIWLYGHIGAIRNWSRQDQR